MEITGILSHPVLEKFVKVTVLLNNKLLKSSFDVIFSLVIENIYSHELLEFDVAST